LGAPPPPQPRSKQSATVETNKRLSPEFKQTPRATVVGVGPIPVGSIHNTAQKNTKNQTKKTRPRQQNPKKYKKTN
jgi:hypothetical protein